MPCRSPLCRQSDLLSLGLSGSTGTSSSSGSAARGAAIWVKKSRFRLGGGLPFLYFPQALYKNTAFCEKISTWSWGRNCSLPGGVVPLGNSFHTFQALGPLNEARPHLRRQRNREAEHSALTQHKMDKFCIRSFMILTVHSMYGWTST